MIQIKIGNLLEIRKFLKAQDFTDRTFVFVYNIVFPIIFALFAPSSLKLQLHSTHIVLHTSNQFQSFFFKFPGSPILSHISHAVRFWNTYRRSGQKICWNLESTISIEKQNNPKCQRIWSSLAVMKKISLRQPAIKWWKSKSLHPMKMVNNFNNKHLAVWIVHLYSPI